MSDTQANNSNQADSNQSKAQAQPDKRPAPNKPPSSQPDQTTVRRFDGAEG